MMLKTSSNKLNPALNMFKLTLRKNLGLLILACIFALLFCPGYVLTYVTDELGVISTHIVDFNDISGSIVAITTVLTSLLVMFLNIINFSYMYSKKSSDVFHALPLTRLELFFSRFFSGFAFSLVPTLLVYVSASLIMLIPRVEGDLSILLIGFAYNVVIALLCSAVSMLFIVCAGTIADIYMSFSAFAFGGLLVASIILNVCDEHLFGFSNESIRSVFEICSPFVFCGGGLADYLSRPLSFTANNTWFFVKAILITAAIVAFSAVLYRRRKAEKAGGGYAYHFMYVIGGLIVSYIGAFAVGIIFAEGYSSSVEFFVFAAVGAAIAAVTFGAISFRGFKTVKKSLIVGGVAFVCLVLTYVIASFGGFGYSTRVPHMNNISSVEVTMQGEAYEVSAKDAVALHKKIVENRNLFEAANDDENEYAYEGNTLRYTNIYIDYKLKNGNTMSRYFYIPIAQFEDELLAVYKGEDRIKQLKSRLDDNMVGINMGCSYTADETGDYTYYSVDLTQSEAVRLVEAYIADLSNATADSLTREDCDGYYINWQKGENEAGWYFEHREIDLTVEPHFTNTKEVLEEIDIKGRIEELKQEELEAQ